LPLFFNFVLEYAIRQVKENKVGMELIGTLQLLVYNDDVKLLGDNTDTIKNNRESLIDARKKVGLEADVEKIKYMLLSRHKNSGRNILKIWHSLNIGERK
jgi:hypothetical protein